MYDSFLIKVIINSCPVAQAHQIILLKICSKFTKPDPYLVFSLEIDLINKRMGKKMEY